MSLLTIPNTLVNGTGPANIIDAVALNANFTAVATAVNNIYPSQILPITTAQATFGATATGVGYKFLANDATATPLTVSGVSAQTGDIMDWNTSGGKVMFVAAGGQLAFVNTGLSTGPGASVLQISADGGATPGFQFNIPTSSTNGYRFLVNEATTVMQIVGGVLQIGANAQGLGAGDFALGNAAGSARIWMGTSNTTAGFFDFGATTAGKYSFQLDPSVLSYAPVNGGLYTNASDAAFKSNIAPLASGTTEIMALKPSSFTINASGTPSLGFIAQDVQQVLPDLVSADGNGMLGVCYDGIIPVLVKAFQEMQSGLHAAGVAGF